MPEPVKTSKCPDEKDIYADVNFCRGSISMPGTRNYFYYIPKRFIVTWPTFTVPTALKDVPVMTGDFVLQSDKKWHRVDCVPNKNKFTSETIGGYGTKHFLNSANIKIPGTEEEATGYCTQLSNEDAVFLVPQRNGKFRVIGNKNFSVDLKLSQDSGEGKDDENATTIVAEVEDAVMTPFYKGKIETADGDISGETGELIVPGA